MNKFAMKVCENYSFKHVMSKKKIESKKWILFNIVLFYIFLLYLRNLLVTGFLKSNLFIYLSF